MWTVANMPHRLWQSMDRNGMHEKNGPSMIVIPRLAISLGGLISANSQSSCLICVILESLSIWDIPEVQLKTDE